MIEKYHYKSEKCQCAYNSKEIRMRCTRYLIFIETQRNSTGVGSSLALRSWEYMYTHV